MTPALVGAAASLLALCALLRDADLPASTAQVQLPGVRYLDIEGRVPMARLALAALPATAQAMPIVRHLWQLAQGHAAGRRG